MSHSSKSKAKGISASSFLDLKAEISKQEADFAKAKAAGADTAIVGGVKRPGKKPTVWARQNVGVNARAARDIQLEEIALPTLNSARAALERKAKIYDKLLKGKTGGLNDAQYDALLVDFDSKAVSSKYYNEDSEGEDESLSIPTRPEDDPLVEYEDEFGRMRTAKRSEVPRNMVQNREDEVDEDEDIIIRNPVNHFPTYQPSEERMAEIAKTYAEENNPLGVHYDASKEVRAKGAGFYQFSGDEETRAAQMQELKASREETARTRKELGAEDVKFGEVEGMRAGDGNGSSGGVTLGTSRAMEKRKRDLEERRQLLEAKRRKIKTPGTSTSASSNLLGHETTVGSSKQIPLPILSSTPGGQPPLQTNDTKTTSRTNQPSEDPFSLLEAQTLPSSKQKGKTKFLPAANEADSFLAQLEHEFLGSRIKK